MTLTTILLENAPQGGGLSGMLMIVAMIVIFYFFMIRPQSKKQKEIKKAREALNKGEGTVSVEIAPEVNIKVSLDSIYPAGPEKKAEKKAEK